MSIFPKKQAKRVAVNAENHGYKPDVITLKSSKSAQVKFIPFDNTSCMNKVVSKDLGIDKVLDDKSKVVVSTPTDKPGTYNFAYEMDILHRRVVVK